jgi:LmbE family N-acetylglucosaminyl deacetylase
MDAESESKLVELGLKAHVVVVSPHLDDAVLSLGATMARTARLGAHWSIVTVFSGDPDSKGPAARYERRCGFLSAGEAASVRRQEDQRACAILGTRPVWLPFGGIQYEPVRDADRVWTALEPHINRAELLLLPGFPLTHLDHAWITELVLARTPKNAPIGFYAEQPYARSAPPPHDWQALIAERSVRWVSLHAGIGDRFAKGRACRAYWSQFRTFGCHLPRRCLVPELFWTDECLGWPKGGTFKNRVWP